MKLFWSSLTVIQYKIELGNIRRENRRERTICYRSNGMWNPKPSSTGQERTGCDLLLSWLLLWKEVISCCLQVSRSICFRANLPLSILILLQFPFWLCSGLKSWNNYCYKRKEKLVYFSCLQTRYSLFKKLTTKKNIVEINRSM